MPTMNAQSISLCSILIYAACFTTEVGAFTTGGAGTISRAPIAKRQQWEQGVEIELPDTELLFERIGMASPLAKMVMEGDATCGFEAIDDNAKHPDLKWKKVEDNKRKTVHRIDKADSFQNVRTPLLRFRSTIKGPCIGERFSNMIMDLEERKKWDDQVAKVEEMYPIEDLDHVNAILGDQEKYGTCTRLGVGYTQTKSGILSPREQLTLGGMQEYDNGATILWGTEMEEYHNHLLPEGQRHTRAKSHLFAATLAPTGPDSFDVEYLLQMDVGGGVPHFLSTPALTDAVKKLFHHAKTYFEGEEVELYLKSRQEQQQAEYSEIELLSTDEEIDMSSADDGLAMMASLLFTP